MWTIVFWITVIVAVIGLIAKFVTDAIQSICEITWKEYPLTVAGVLFFVAPLLSFAGWHFAVQNQYTFNEFWNGWETQAVWDRIACSRDGPCRWEYDCDPYQVPYDCNCTTDSKGNQSCQTCYRTEYHDCPYVNEEWTFRILTTLGEYTIDEHRFPDNPRSNRWEPERNESLSDSVISQAGVGIPQFWADANNRIEHGKPGPVTIRKSYANYLLASQYTILKSHSSDMERFKTEGLFPKVATEIHSFYAADKVYFVGFRPSDASRWQEALMYLNAKLGNDLKGDLHLVLVKNATISADPDAYTQALQAHWQNVLEPNVGKDAIAKNSILVVAGTDDGATVSWARVATGMPLGNELLISHLQGSLKGIPLKPETVIGSVHRFGVPHKESVGAIQRAVFGIENPATKFTRVSMSAKDADDVGRGFLYLKNELRPTEKQTALILLIGSIIASLTWAAALLIGERQGLGYSRNRNSYGNPYNR